MSCVPKHISDQFARNFTARIFLIFIFTGGCVIINDTSSQTRLLEEILKQKRTVTSYEGYLVNEVS